MAVPTGPAINKAVINQLRQFGDELVQKVTKTFLESSPARVAAIRAAFVANDAARVEAEAHTLKSSCGQLGATFMEEMCAQAEQFGHERRVDAVGGVVARLEAEFLRVQEELTKLVP
jgi:HPt (histidine-containing phosphotransfer) domain-containing protein